MANIFLSYRRGGTRADTGRIYDRLSAYFDEASVFMDIDDIDPGENFVHKLETILSTCDVMLVMIGSLWAEARSENGQLRLGEEGDFVSMEVQQALKRGISIIPVLVGGAKMPSVQQLPDNLAELAQHQAIEITDQRFHADVDVLIEAIERSYTPAIRQGSKRKTIIAITLVLLLLCAFLVLILTSEKEYSLRNESSLLNVYQAKAILVKENFFDISWNRSGQGIENQFSVKVINGDLVVIDNSTKLMWQKSGSGKVMKFEMAQSYIKSLNSRRFADHGDWRLPTFEEAMSLMEPEKHDAYYIAPDFESGAAPFVFTSDLTPERTPWVVYYYDGSIRPESVEFNASVRAVRTAH